MSAPKCMAEMRWNMSFALSASHAWIGVISVRACTHMNVGIGKVMASYSSVLFYSSMSLLVLQKREYLV